MAFSVESAQWTANSDPLSLLITDNRSLALSLRPDVAEDLGDVVEHDEGEEDHQNHKGCLVDPLLHVQADIVPQHALDEQQQDQSSIEDRKRQEIQNAEIDADGSGQAELRQVTL